MLAYLDTSMLLRAYLADEPDHEAAAALLDDPDALLVSSSWTRVEAASAIVRAGAAGRCDAPLVLSVVEADLAADGAVTLLAPDQGDLEAEALAIVRTFALRSLDALHLACAVLAAVPLLPPGERLGFATRDAAQGAAAEAIGFTVL